MRLFAPRCCLTASAGFGPAEPFRLSSALSLASLGAHHSPPAPTQESLKRGLLFLLSVLILAELGGNMKYAGGNFFIKSLLPHTPEKQSG